MARIVLVADYKRHPRFRYAQGLAWRGVARSGRARLSKARYGVARRGVAWRVLGRDYNSPLLVRFSAV